MHRSCFDQIAVMNQDKEEGKVGKDSGSWFADAFFKQLSRHRIHQQRPLFQRHRLCSSQRWNAGVAEDDAGAATFLQ
jgi:hypothetical protein